MGRTEDCNQQISIKPNSLLRRRGHPQTTVPTDGAANSAISATRLTGQNNLTTPSQYLLRVTDERFTSDPGIEPMLNAVLIAPAPECIDRAQLAAELLAQ